MEAKDIPHIQEKVFASALMYTTAGKAAEIIDKFSSWLFVGYGGAITFLISNTPALGSHVPSETLQCAVQMLVPVAVLAIIEKMLAAFVLSSNAGAILGRELAEKAIAAGIELDPKALFGEVSPAIFWPMRIFVEGSIKKVLAGDFTSRPRQILRTVQLQGISALIQSGCVLYAIWQLAANVRY